MTSSWPLWLRSFSSPDIGFRWGDPPLFDRARWARSTLWGATVALCVLGCGSPAPVVRQRGTTAELGRVIPPSAYAHFMAGLRAESTQATEEARELYMAALRADPQAGAAWAGLVRTACSLPGDKVQDVLSAALRSADRPALPLVAFAQCKLTAKKKSALLKAERASRRALQHEPLLKQASATLQAALHAQGRGREARRVRDGYELYSGELLPAAARASDGQSAQAPWRDIDRHILRGEIHRARDAAAGQVTLGELTVRTLALGDPHAALQMAQQVLINEADNPNAQLVLALAHRPPPLEEVARLLHNPRMDVCPLGVVLLALELKPTQPDMARHLLDEFSLDSAAQDDALLDRWLREARR